MSHSLLLVLLHLCVFDAVSSSRIYQASYMMRAMMMMNLLLMTMMSNTHLSIKSRTVMKLAVESTESPFLI